MKSRVEGSVVASLDDFDPHIGGTGVIHTHLFHGSDFVYWDAVICEAAGTLVTWPAHSCSFLYVQNLDALIPLDIVFDDSDGNISSFVISPGGYLVVTGVDSSTYLCNLATTDPQQSVFARVFAIGSATLGHETGSSDGESPPNGLNG